MEGISTSGNDSDSDSDEYSKEVEEELYSVLHYNDFSKGIPPSMLKKYSISKMNNDYVISLNGNHSKASDDISVVEDEHPRKKKVIKRQVTPESNGSSSDSDVVVVEPDSSKTTSRVRAKSKSKFETVHIECSGSDSSVEIVNTTSNKRRHSDDSVIDLSDEDDEFDLSINTTTAYDSDGNVSDVVGETKFDWAGVASPSSWTREMRRYYNKTCHQLRHFDHKKIRQEIQKGKSKWFLLPSDRHPNYPSHRPRCFICRQADHIASNCPKQDPTCHMCGTQGHTNYQCPNSICLQCGKKSKRFTSMCHSCYHTVDRECYICRQAGHEQRACPEKWREFHSTVEGNVKKTPLHTGGHTQCCNCGDSRHIYEHCNKPYLSDTTKSLPAYSWLFGKGGFQEWRYSGNWPVDHGSPHKKPRANRFNGNFFDDRRFPHSMPKFKANSPWSQQKEHRGKRR